MNGQDRLGMVHWDKGPDQIFGQLRLSSHLLVTAGQLGVDESKAREGPVGPR
jgi:hypothetical protein